MQTLVFDVYGDLGHFKKFYTTSSPLTFAFPPPPTVRGMLGAIVGCDKSEYLDVFSHSNCKIAIRILAPVKKMRMGLNYINTKGNFWIPTKKRYHEARTQITVEFVKDPTYRLYVTHKDSDVFKELNSNVKQGKMVFSLSMGLSELLATTRYRDTTAFHMKSDIRAKVDSVIPMNMIGEYGVVFEDGKRYFRERLAIDMNKERIVKNYSDVLFETQGKAIDAHVKMCWAGRGGESIIFF